MTDSAVTDSTPLAELFNDKGWQVVPNILEPERVADVRDFLMSRREALQAGFEKWIGEKIESDKDYGRHQAAIPEYEDRGLEKDHRHYLTGEFDLDTRLDMRIVRLLESERVRKAISEQVGQDTYQIHYPPMMRFKCADSPGSLLPPHQDGPYNAHMTDFITVWVPLVDIDEEVGGIIAYNGSHLTPDMEHVSAGPWAFGTKDEPTGFEEERVLMKAGDILMFPRNFIHKSAPQLSQERKRYSIDFRIFRNPEDTKKSYYDPQEDKIVRLH